MSNNPNKPIQPSKKHLARIERERQQTRYILIGSAIVLLLVIGVVVYGVLDQSVLRARQPVATVNGDSISTSAWQAQVRYGRYALIRQAMNTYQFMQYFGSDPSTQSGFVSQLSQIKAQMDPTTVGKTVLDEMINDKLIRQEAKKRGITVTPAEVDEAFKAAFGYFPNGSPTPSPTFPELPTATLSPLQKTLTAPTATPITTTAPLTGTAIVTGTPAATATALVPQATTLPAPTLVVTTSLPLTATTVPTGTLDLTATATTAPTATHAPTATPTQAPTASPTLAATATLSPTKVVTPTLTPLPSETPTPYTEQGFAQLKSTTIATFQKDYQISESDLRYIIESGVYREKVLKAVVGELPKTQEQVWARHILVADEATAKTVQEQLNKGMSFCNAAAKFSTDTSNKDKCGDLGWFPSGQMVKEFEDAAFALKVGEVSTPVKSQFGYHIIQALGHETRSLTAQAYDQERQKKFQDWLDTTRKASKVDIKDYWQQRVPEIPTLPPEIDQIIQQSQQQQAIPGLPSEVAPPVVTP